MSELITYLLEFSLGAIFLYAYYFLAWKNNHAFELKRIILLGILFIAILFPFISIESNTIPALTEGFQLNQIDLNLISPNESYHFFNWPSILLSIYFLGVFISLILGLKGLWQIVYIQINSNSEFRGDHSFVQIKEDFPTFSFLNTLYWNDQSPLNENEREMVYSHELTHIRQLHSLDLILISICRIVFWFNPVMHLMHKEMALVQECIADREVVRNHSVGNYLSLLANQTIYNMQHQWINQFASVSSLKRIHAIKNTKRGSVAFRLLIMIPLITLLFTAISCENSIEGVNDNMESIDSAFVTDADEKPTFVGGMEALITYFSEAVKYPESARKEGIEGKVFISFIIEEDGSVSNAEIIKGVDKALDAEALRVVESMPKWNPGSNDGQSVKVKMTLPIAFKL